MDDITMGFDGDAIMDGAAKPSDYQAEWPDLTNSAEARVIPEVVTLDQGEALDAADEAEAVAADPSDEELLEAAQALGTDQVQDESPDTEQSEGYLRLLALIDEAVPLPEGFPTFEDRAELMQKFGRLRIRRVAPREAFLVRMIRRVDMPTFYRIQSAAAELENGVEAEIWFENEIAKAFCLFPVITDADIYEGTGSLAAGGTVAQIARDIMAISNLAISDDVGMVEDL